MLPDRLSKGEEVSLKPLPQRCPPLSSLIPLSLPDFLLLLQFPETHSLREVFCCQETKVLSSDIEFLLLGPV